jgi:hypothetical protein
MKGLACRRRVRFIVVEREPVFRERGRRWIIVPRATFGLVACYTVRPQPMPVVSIPTSSKALPI